MIKKIAISVSLFSILFGLHTTSVYAATFSEVKESARVGAAAVLDATVIQDVSVKEDISFWGYTNLGIANVEKYLNIRETPSTTGKLIGKIGNLAACEILSTKDGWAYISSGSVTGYVSQEFLFTGADAVLKAVEAVQTVAVVQCDALKVREFPNTDCQVMLTVPSGQELEYVSDEDGWVKVLIDDEEAYVSSEFVAIETKLKTAFTLTELFYGEGVSDLRVDLCEYAKQFLGNPYVWGGISLTKGADCSGFVLSVYKEFGYDLPHSSKSQAGSGTKVSASEAKPGDLFFYSKNGSINHVAVYIGNGQVIHASSPKYGIRISNAYYRTPTKVVSILP